jgi:hypothetical protein
VHSRLSALLEQQPLPAAARAEALRQEQAVCELRIMQLHRSKVGDFDFVGKAFSKGIARTRMRNSHEDYYEEPV